MDRFTCEVATTELTKFLQEGPIKATELIVKISIFLYNTGTVTQPFGDPTAHSDELVDLMYELAAQGNYLEAEYNRLEMPYRTKSIFYLPGQESQVLQMISAEKGRLHRPLGG